MKDSPSSSHAASASAAISEDVLEEIIIAPNLSLRPSMFGVTLSRDRDEPKK